MARLTIRTPYNTNTYSPFMNRSQVDQLQIQSQAQTAANQLEFAKKKYENLLSMYKTAVGAYGSTPAANVPPEFAQNIALFQPGGQYGAGSEAAIAQGQQQEISAGNIASAAAGMGSSTTAMARTNAAIRSARNARLLADEERLKLLGGALTGAGQAGLETQRLDAYKQEALLRSLASLS